MNEVRQRAKLLGLGHNTRRVAGRRSAHETRGGAGTDAMGEVDQVDARAQVH